MARRFLTTPIYYVNAEPHIGHAYTNLATDALARFYRAAGDDVYFLTGTDEHGEKIERTARDQNKTPEELVDEVVETFRQLWSDLNLSHDRFIRTTDAEHEAGVQHAFQQLYDQGDIYLDTFEGPYCVPCESYWTESQLEDGENCPSCGRPVEHLSEESYFFRITDYLDDLEDFLDDNPGFVRPRTRLNEVRNMVETNEGDLSVSRTRFDWGVPVPFDDDHVVYVWFDALLNYLTGIGYPEEDYKKWWPADVHVIGKDILRFHAVIWPCMLMALDIEPPRRVHAHGWWTLEGEKISKSTGNVVDPRELADEYGRDQLRYFLLRQIPFGDDGVMSDRAIVETINSDLANDLGNLVSRVLNMIDQYREGSVPEVNPAGELAGAAKDARTAYRERMEELAFDRALKSLLEFVRHVNGWLQEQAPWEMHGDDAREDQLDEVLYELAEALNEIAYLSRAVMPESAAEIWNRLDHDPGQTLADREWGELSGGESISVGSALFPRIQTSD